MKPLAQPTRAGHDRWLVSYADLVTLLFALFIMLYAAGQASEPVVQRKAVSQPAAVDTAGAEIVSADGASAEVPLASQAATDTDVESLADRLSTRLADDVRLQRADILRDGRGLVVSLPEQATFAVGSADVSADAKPLIAKVVNELSSDGYALRIEGHTDDVPIRTAKYPSNWELSTARAGAVVAYLITDLKFPAARLSAAGYGEFHPRVPNDSAASRAMNRRIDIVVLPMAGEAAGEGVSQ